MYAFYLLHLISRGVPSRIVLLTLSLAGLFSSVSVGHVIQNMPQVSNVNALFSFYTSALSNAEILVKVIVLALVVSALFLARDIVYNVRSYFSRRLVGAR